MLDAKRREIIEYVEGLKCVLEFMKVVSFEDIKEDDIFDMDDVLEELDRQGINYKLHNYIDDYGVLRELGGWEIYCNDLYKEDYFE